jgi:hypothetical protein
MKSEWPWVALVSLGAYHGLNPGMGWLFALSLGLQNKSRVAVLRALLPIGIGHAAAISLTILAIEIFEYVLTPTTLRILVACALFAFGIHLMVRARHPRGGGMRVGFRDLAFWSFLMASAHGAGLMLTPILLAQPMLGMNHRMNTANVHVVAISGSVLGMAVVVHTLGLVMATGIIAMLCYQSYEKSGLRILQRAWFNFDLLWAIALFAAAATLSI